MLKIAILDDYAKVALQSADWSVLRGKAEITVFDRHLSEDEAVSLLQPFDVLCTIRERMSLPRSLFQRLPNLKLVTILGMSLPNLDLAAAAEHGVIVAHSNFANPIYAGIFNATPELTWGLMIAVVRHFDLASRRMRTGGWQSTVGTILAGRTLGLLGLGRIGKRMAAYGRAFDMPVIAWSQNLTDEAAAAVGARRVEKDELFRLADILSIHVQLSDRTRGPGHGARTRSDEVRGLSDQHVARADRGRGRSHCGAAGRANRRRRDRRLRCRAACGRSSFPHDG